VIPFVIVLWAALGLAQTSISAAEAKKHVGEKATVCGEVASTHYATSSRGNPTFINLDKSYPNQIFTVLIWGTNRPKFGDPEEAYRSKHICVTGKISDYKGVPEIIAYEPSQIKVQ
jgi:DNA/RNA endonuclease YhcR with UshA esterase domain